MDPWHVTSDIAVLLGVALVFALALERIKQSALLGYLTAGLVLGPAGLGVVQDEAVIHGFAELGVTLLLFTIGLEFSWNRLRTLGRLAVIGGTLQLILTIVAVTACCAALGLSLKASCAVGIVVAPSSTAFVLRLLYERGELEAVHGRAALAVLLLQDVAVVPLVLAMTIMGGSGDEDGALVQVGRSALLVLAFMLAFYLLHKYVLPRALDAAVLSKNREIPLLLALTVCLASAWFAHAIQLSPVLGAFVAGVLLGESPYATWIRADTSSFRIAFVAIFFASIGMIGDVNWIAAHWYWFLACLPAVIFGKAIIAWLAVRMAGVSAPYALGCGLSLAQTGEFSFVLAQIGHENGVLSTDVFRLVVGLTVGTLFLTPYFVAWSGRHVNLRGKRGRGAGGESGSIDPGESAGHVIVVGSGPAGRTVTDALFGRRGLVVIDLNPRGAHASAEGLHVLVGDARQPEVLEKARVETAKAIVITIPDHNAARQIILLAKDLAPDIGVFVRARYHRFANQLRFEGAHVVDEEEITGRTLAEEVQDYLGLVRSIPAGDVT